MKIHLQLTPKLILFHVCFAALLLIFVGILAAYSIHQAIETVAISDLSSTAMDRQNAVDTWLTRQQSVLVDLSNAPSLQTAFVNFVNLDSSGKQTAHDQIVANVFPQVGTTHPFLEIFLIQAETGQIIASTDPTHEGKFVQDQPYFINGKDTPYIDKPTYSTELKKLTMIVAVPLHANPGQGILAGRLNLGQITPVVLRHSGPQQTEDAYLVDASSHLLLTQPRFMTDPTVLQQGIHTTAVEQCLSGKSGIVYDADYRGIPALAVYRWWGERELCLVVKVDQVEALAPSTAFNQTLVLISVLALLIALIFSIGLARTITRPVLALQGGVEQLTQGTLTVRLPESSGDELSVLAHGFNVMTDALTQKEAQLARYTGELETKVQQAVKRVSRLQEVTAALSGSVTSADVATVFVNFAVKAVGGAAGSLVKLSDLQTLEFLVTYPADLGSKWQPFSLDTPFPLSEAVRTQTPTWVTSQDNWLTRYGSPSVSPQYHAWAALPLIVKGKTVGSIGFSFTDAQEFAEEDKSLMIALATQCAQALDRVMLYETQQHAHAEAEAAKQRLTFLLETSTLVAESTDYLARLQQLARQTVPAIADWCAIEILGEDDLLQRLAVVHIDPAKIALAFELQRRFPPDPTAERGVYRVLRTGQSELYSEIPDAMLTASIQNEEQLAMARQLGLRSAMSVPLMTHGRGLGVITLVMAESDRRYGSKDLELAEDLARRAAMLIENARLYEETQRLNADLEQRVAERTAQLEAANKELEAFSYSVSHDLRAPLRSIDGFARMLVRDYGAQLPPDGQHRLEVVRHNAQQMGRLIDDLLTFSRLSRQPISKRSVALGDIVRQSLETLTSEVENRQVEITIADLPTCQADPALLKLVFINLLANALKFTRQREMAKIVVGSQQIDGQTTFFVQDNGAGFDMQYYDKLFGVFQRLHRAEEFEGTGVGLAIVQRIIARHGGRVWAEGALDQGATFYFTLHGKGVSDG